MHLIRSGGTTIIFYSLIEKIKDAVGYPVVVIGPENEVDHFKQDLGDCAQNLLFGPPVGFNQAAALMHKSAMLICNEGALNHLSVATGTPCVSIFGPHSSLYWSPQDVFPYHYHVKNSAVEVWSDPHFGLTVDDVLQKVIVLFKEIVNDRYSAANGPLYSVCVADN